MTSNAQSAKTTYPHEPTLAHRGASTSAYSDAVAKAYLGEEMGTAQARELEKAMVVERRGREFGYVVGGGGGWAAPWHDAIFGMMAEATGEWIRRREAERVKTGPAPEGTTMVDEERLGRVDVKGNPRRWRLVIQS